MLITTIEQFIQSVPTAAGVEDFADLKPYVESAEIWLKSNITGAELFDAVASVPENSVHKLCCSVVANHAYWDAIPFLDLVHTNTGFGVVQNNNLAPASRDRVERLRDHCLTRRDNEIDELIELIISDPALFGIWKQTPFYAETFNSLVPTTKTFNRFQAIESRATFLKLKGNILSLEKTTIAEYISSEFLQELLGQTKNNSFPEENRLIINNLRDAVCKLSIAQGVDNMSVIISTSGIVQARVASQFNYAREERLRGIKDGFEKLGYKLLNRVVDFMADNIEKFPTYAASKEYAARIAPGYENSEDSPIFSSLF